MKLREHRYGFRSVFQRKKVAFYLSAAILFGLSLVYAGLTYYIQPNMYVGKVRMEINHEPWSFEIFPGNSPKQEVASAESLATERMIVTSKETLYRAIDELGLVKKWDDAKTRPDAYALLLDKIELDHHPGTSLIDLSVRHFDPEEAAALANAIASAYGERRRIRESNRISAGIDMLNAQSALQSQRVEEARLQMILLMEKFRVVDLGAIQGTDATGGTEISETPETGRGAQVRQAQLEALRKRIELVRLDAEMRNYISSDGDILLVKLLNQNSEFLREGMRGHLDAFDKARARLAVLDTTDTPATAREVTSLRATADHHLAEIESGIENLRAVLAQKLETEKKALERIEAIERQQEAAFMDEQKIYVQYQESRRNFEQQKRLLDRMEERLIREKIDLNMPFDSVVIHEIAVPGERPITPSFLEKLWQGVLWGLLIATLGGIACMYASAIGDHRDASVS